MKIVAKSLFVVLLTAFGTAHPGHAQTPKSKNAPAPAAAPAAPQADAAAPNNSGWVARCTSASRDAPLECAMEQTAVLTKTGQLIVLVNIRVPGDTRTPVALIQLPLGLNLPVGAKLQVDDGKAVDVPIQTCEARGCYINTPIAADVLTELKSGKQLKVSFQNLGKETISIPMPLADFATVYDKIK
ncbi:invasion associated locus B family protein [Bradyrhizobium elkanii]|uniref:Invasion associated locus B family protein n=1 Tax=Bradyrhizobium elkanii TaxID=29448 RepID=A0A4U6S1H6_BRAEL|nr:invasion associated locus B family protein [Bradyrhizobium sp. BR2003]TKV79852.1 invasion associated locus B family protein [Bradyrhizobium elkanii]